LTTFACRLRMLPPVAEGVALGTALKPVRAADELESAAELECGALLEAEDDEGGTEDEVGVAELDGGGVQVLVGVVWCVLVVFGGGGGVEVVVGGGGGGLDVVVGAGSPPPTVQLPYPSLSKMPR
jgi:hypothetical protein